ncbi:MAG: response regulator [Geminicoccaceae bacterium]
MHVLLAEDNPVNQEVSAGLLEALDCDVTVVENGQEAVEAARSGTFDLVLMDCQMPVMDGLEATSILRKTWSENKRLPIIALTADKVEDAKAACFAAGMDDFLSKPFTLQQLQALLQRWQPAAEMTPTAAHAATAETASTAMPETASLDLTPIEALRSLDPSGERNIVQRAITKFISYSDELLARLTSAVGESDGEEISRIAHSLKSSSANLGATDLARQCSELEKLFCDNRLPDDIHVRLKNLQAAQQAAKNALLQLAGTQ